MKTTEQYFQEFYNEMRYQIEQGAKANFTRANKIWAEYEAQQSEQEEEIEIDPVIQALRNLGDAMDQNC